MTDHHRWNIERDGEDLLICDGSHEKWQGCNFIRYSPTAEIERLRARERAVRNEALEEAALAVEDRLKVMSCTCSFDAAAAIRAMKDE